MKKFELSLKLLLLCIIFFWIIKVVNINETFKLLLQVNLYYFFLSFLLNNLSSFFLTIKWFRLASPLKIKSSFLEFFKLNYISMFYSMFVPGQASGELIKGLKLARKEDSGQKVWIPIFIDKTTNLLITLIIGFVAILYDKSFSQNTNIIFIVSSLVVFFTLVTLFLFSDKTSRFASLLKNFLKNILKLFKIKSDFLKDFSLNYFEEYKKHNFLMYETFFWSLLIKLPHILSYYLLAMSLNINLNIIQSAWVFSIVSIASLLPISFSGLGVREGTVIVLLSQIGISNVSALSFSMLIFTTALFTGLIGGILELLSNFRIKR